MSEREINELADKIVEVIMTDTGRGWAESVRFGVVSVLSESTILRRRQAFATEPFRSLDERVTALELALGEIRP
jgi:hypothetical protein